MSSKRGTLSRIKRREKIDGWLFVLPFVISTLVFFAGPLLVAFILSFKEYSFLDQNTIWQAKWVGFDNYINAFKDPIFKRLY
ncbi:hypothetical protein PL321_00690 [Caloramator sp. mosi_1]|uniref:hypothetical protein n=1 Tax=Caloramator sp. mosi_1 TaxID=3023090 RepID=UPI0023608AE6|nr:hypothetical protein [Caloramator sp. mosi_1]WDC84386.1 hypothetical protein PL321_00690 [Caloramator sp. mosi_1]